MSDSTYSFDVSTDQFEVSVLQNSHQVPVLVDFWAAWCAPCRTLKPMLEQLAVAYDGAFLLAKVNTEEEQELATHFGIRSLPTVKLFKDGQPIDEFMGALPEEAVRELLDRHIQAPASAAELLREQAQTALAAGDPDQALTLLQRAVSEDPNDHLSRIDLAELLLEQGDVDAARACLKHLTIEQQDLPESKALLARLQFAGEGPLDLAALRQQADSAPDDQALRMNLVDALVQSAEYAAAMDQLLTLISDGNGEAQGKMLAIFELLGDDPLVKTYRSRLFNTLH